MTNEDFSCDHANTPEQSLEAEARENFVTADVVSWDKKRQFGFVMIDGKRAFIHQSSIIPVYKKPVDFSGSTLVVDRKSISIDPTTKKISVEKAYTETRFQEMSQSLIRRAEDAIRFDRERTKNQLELVSQTTDLQKFIDSMEITPDGLHPGFKQDIRLCMSAEEAELKSFDEKNGPMVEFTYTFTCSKNHHEIRLTTTRHVRGWSWAKVSPNPGQIIPNPKTKMVDVAFVLKGANSSHRSLPFLHFSPTCTPPTISDQRIIQTLTIETPLGPIEHEIVLYANPNLERVIFSPSWNGEDIQTLKQEVDARAPSKEAHEQELRRHAAIKEMSDDGLMLDVFPDQETIRVPWDAIRSYAPSQRMAHISEYSYMVPGDDGFIDVRDWGHIRLINFKAGRKNSGFDDYFIQTSERSNDIPTFDQALASIKAHCEARWNEEKSEKERAEKEKAEGERMEKEKAEQERIDTERQRSSSTLNDGSSSETSATPIARLPELKPLSEMDEVSILEEYERNKTEIVTLTTEHPSLQALAEELDKVLNEREVVVHEIHRRRQEVPKKQYPEGNRLGDLNKKATFLFNRMNDLKKALEPLATQRARLQRLLKRQAEIEQL